jgi:hypothetical protein
MVNMSRSIPTLLIATALLAAPACAARATFYGQQRDVRDFERRAYDNGYRQGLDNGERDARDRRDFRIDRDGAYRDGYDRSFDDRDQYRRFFRDGYRAGYTEGYNRLARFERRGGYPGNGGAFPGNDRNVGSPAARVGYRDGFEAGRNDANDRENYDPRRSKRYREGDHDFDRDYGSRDQYKLEYRAAFMQGYDEGYRGNRR